MPLAFVRHISDDNHGKATIFSLGKFWHVKIQADGEELFFGDGWDELVSALELNEGFSLVFRYEGNMVFTIKVFDKSGCRQFNILKKRKLISPADDTSTEINAMKS